MRIKITSKKTIVSVFAMGVFLLSQLVPLVFAEDLGVSGLMHDVNNFQNQASKAAVQQQRKLSDVISRANSLIANRITTLNILNTRIQNDTRLTIAEKTALSGQIQTTISGLTSLKTKINADTSVQTALSDAKQIFTTYRVYEVLEPQIRILIILNNIQTMITRVQGLTPQLQSLITSLQSQGKDVSQLTPLLADITSQLQTISSTINADTATIQNVNPNTPNPQTIFQQVRSDIQNIIKADFQKIRQDVQQMRPIFRQLIFPNANPSSQPSTSGISVTAAPTH